MVGGRPESPAKWEALGQLPSTTCQLPHTVLWRGLARGTFCSPEYAVAPFDRAVLSWNSDGPAAFALEVNGAHYCMGHWGDQPRSERTDFVDVDTLALPSPARSFRFQVDAAPGTAVTLAAVAHWREKRRRPIQDPKRKIRNPQAWGEVLRVPERSQFLEEKDAAGICSPTAVAMVLEFHGIKKSTREVADGVYDHAARIYGNWPFNTAYAHRVSGLETFVCRGVGLECLEAEIALGRPVVISHQWRAGELEGAPLPESAGHLTVVVGFTPQGDVVVNDPAGWPGSVRRVYKRREIQRTWLERGRGIMYVMRRQRRIL